MVQWSRTPRVFAFSSSPSPQPPSIVPFILPPETHKSSESSRIKSVLQWLESDNRNNQAREYPVYDRVEEASTDQGISFKSPIISFSVLVCRPRDVPWVSSAGQVPGDRLVKFCDIQIIQMQMPPYWPLTNRKPPTSDLLLDLNKRWWKEKKTRTFKIAHSYFLINLDDNPIFYLI